MMRGIIYWLTIIVLLLDGSNALAQTNELAHNNIIWTTQSKNASESMPCGGGSIGLNVWVENGDIYYYLSKSGTFDENNQMLKLGRVKLNLSNHPFAGSDFKQILQLQDGSILISGNNTSVTIWVDIFRSVVHADIESKKPISINASYQSWRYNNHIITGGEFKANSYKVPQLFEVKTFKDEINFKDNTIEFYHRNKTDTANIFDYTVRMEGMQAVKDKMFDPISNNTFGGLMRGNNMHAVGNDFDSYANTPYKSWQLSSNKPATKHQIEIFLQVAQTNTLQAWLDSLNTLVKEATLSNKTARAQSQQWWKQYWQRSFIYLNENDTSINYISRNYQLFRYQLGCNAYGQWPTKFNGGLFTFDPIYVNNKYPYSPDFRLWGGGTMTAQNQRLVYWPMLKSGDFDMMQPQFDFYLKNQLNAELRSNIYWNHHGASFTEQLENFGLPNITEYSIKRPTGYDPGMEYNAWLEYEWETVFEFCMMMLETERYQQKNISHYIPFIESCLSFYDEHYQQLAQKRGVKTFDENGHYIFYPSSAAESFKLTYNSTTVISALQVILDRLLQLPIKYIDSTQQKKWRTMQQRLPTIPLQQIAGHTTLAPAETWARVQNSETPQLYPVFPWGIYGIGKPGLDTAINTYLYDAHAVKYRSAIGWRQSNIFAARLGLIDEAAALTKEKWRDGPHRFPSFWGPGFDWTPDHNWGGSGMIGLQEMLVQTDDKKILLFPTWKKNWDVHFKLHAPYNTTIEATLKNGVIVQLEVLPKERMKDIINLLQN